MFAEPVYNLIERNNSKVCLVADHQISSIVRNLSEPYTIWEKKLDSITNIWTIIVCDGTAISKQATREIISVSKGEPEFQYFFLANEKKIFIESHFDIRWIIQHVIRLIRVILRMQHYDEGSMYLHGGLVSLNKVGIGILGGKKAGKTSTILSLLAQTESNFITNDDISLQYFEKEWIGKGWQRSMSIRTDTLNNIDIPINIDNLMHPYNGNKYNSVYLYPFEIAQIFNRPILSEISLNFFIFPHFLPHKDDSAYIIPMSSSEALVALQENIIINPGKQNEFLLPYFKLKSKEELYEYLKLISVSIPCFNLYQSFEKLDKGTELIKEVAANII